MHSIANLHTNYSVLIVTASQLKRGNKTARGLPKDICKLQPPSAKCAGQQTPTRRLARTRVPKKLVIRLLRIATPIAAAFR